jgi:hypothetical protein
VDAALSAALAPWCKPRAVHDPGKVLLDLALVTVLGGDCLADVAMLWAEPALFGPVASDPTVSRLVDALAAAGSRALAAIRTARADVRDRVWQSARPDAPRLFSAAAQLVTTGRRRILRLATHWPWTDVITETPQRLAALPNPG